MNLRRLSVLDATQTALLLSLAFLFTAARAPGLLLHGRVVAEEGTTYLRFAWNAKPFAAFIAPHQGYYSLLDNVFALVAARILPLSQAALLFTWVACAVQIGTCWLVISSALAQNFLARLLALLAFLLASGTLGVWLSLENAQFFLPVCVVLILIARSHQVVLGRIVILLVAGLTGVTSCILAPLFALKAVVLRTRAALLELAAIGLTAILQLIVVMYSIHAGYRHSSTSHSAYIGPVLMQRIMLFPLFTGRAVLFSNGFFLHHAALLYVIAAWAMFLLAWVALEVLVLQAGTLPAVLLFAGIWCALLDWSGCYQCDERLFHQSAMYGTRYFFPANVMLNLALAFALLRIRARAPRILCGFLLALVLISGAIQYPRYRSFLNDYPPWSMQVEAWKQNPQQQITVAPPGWRYTLTLPPQHPDLVLPAGIYDSSLATQIH